MGTRQIKEILSSTCTKVILSYTRSRCQVHNRWDPCTDAATASRATSDGGFILKQEAFDSVNKLADGAWFNDTNLQVGCMAVKDCLAPLPCSEEVVVMGPYSIRCIHSWIPGGIGSKGRRLMEVVNNLGQG